MYLGSFLMGDRSVDSREATLSCTILYLLAFLMALASVRIPCAKRVSST